MNSKLTKEKCLFIFIIGCIAGTIYEDLLEGFTNLNSTGIFSFNVHRGVIYGPLNIVYGAGAVLMVLLLKNDKLWYKIYLKGMLIGGAFEYLTSYLQETFIGSISWDYSDLPFNLNGRTALSIMLIWGFACVLLMKIVYPFISRLLDKIPINIMNTLYCVLVVLLILDILISWTALGRQYLRHKGHRPLTFIGEFYDNYYTDEFLKKYFANMKFD